MYEDEDSARRETGVAREELLGGVRELGVRREAEGVVGGARPDGRRADDAVETARELEGAGERGLVRGRERSGEEDEAGSPYRSELLQVLEPGPVADLGEVEVGLVEKEPT